MGYYVGWVGAREHRGRAPSWATGNLSWWGHKDLRPGTCNRSVGQGPVPWSEGH